MRRKLVVTLALALTLYGLIFAPAPMAGAQGRPPIPPGDKCQTKCFVAYRQCLAVCKRKVCPISCDVLFAGCVFNCSPL